MHTSESSPFTWQPPTPRPGLLGAWDRFIGPGATDAELWLMLITSFGAAAAQVAFALGSDVGWSAAQVIVAAVLALDLVGGGVTNATATAKRWYHRRGQGFRAHFGFIVIHAVQPLLVVLFFRTGDWSFFGVVYGYLLLAALVILACPLYLQRPVALTLLLGAFVINAYVLTPTPGLEWLLPVFYTKLLIAHLLKETPFPAPTNLSQAE